MQFAILKPAPYASVYAIAICLLLVLLTVFMTVLFATARNYKLEVSNGRLSIKSLLYNTDIELSRVDAEGVRLVNLKTEGIRFRSRKNGLGVPGLKVGWFAGDGGRYKLYVTDREKVLLIPTQDGYTILFSTNDGQAIIRAIKSEKGE